MIKTLLCGLLCSFAALCIPITSVTLTGVPSGSPVLGVPGLYVSPYTLTVNGATVAGLCIDFDDPADVGQTWNAHLSVVGGDISSTYHVDRPLAYQQEAYIYSQITRAGISARQRTELQQAAWFIMNPSYAAGNSSYAPDAAALQYVADAQAKASSVAANTYLVVSSSDPTLAQEFLIQSDPISISVNPHVVHVPTPEPASCALLGSGLFIAGLLRFFRRQKLSS